MTILAPDPDTPDPTQQSDGPSPEPEGQRRLLTYHRTTARAWLARRCPSCGDRLVYGRCQACREWGA